LSMQKSEANAEFSRFVVKNYEDWMSGDVEAPTMSPNLMRSKIFPTLKEDVPTIMLLLDNLRYDQWKTIEPILNQMFKLEEEDFFYSTLPTTTQYSRNSIFAGMTPLEIQQYYPDWWKNDVDDGGKNLHEEDLLNEQIKRTFRKPIKHEYIKVTNTKNAKSL